MPPPTPLRPLLRAALWLGAGAGCLEVAARAASWQGHGFLDQLRWLGLGVLQNQAVALLGLGLWWVLRRGPPLGFAVAGLIALHAGLWYRYERALNLPAADPRVWVGLLGVVAAALLLGRALARGSWVRPGVGAALAGVGFWLALLRGVPPGPAEGEGWSVLLITLDTTRPDRMGAYGGPAPTPHAARLAREGVRFDQALSPAPLTEPAHLAILTGLSPHRTGVLVNGTPIGEQPASLARRLQAEGLRTGAAVSGFPLHSKYGWRQGFDLYDDDFGAWPGLHRLSLTRAWEQLFLPGNTLRERAGAATLRPALRFLERNAGGRFFFWLHLFDPHGPYEAQPVDGAPRDGAALDLPPYWPPPHRNITSTDWLVSAYDAELTEADRVVGEVLAALEARGALDRTLVVLTADHGESLTEHGLLFDHGDNLHDPSLRVPLIVRAPGLAQPGRTVPCQVTLLDIAPTLLDWLGLPLGEGGGRSLARVAAGGPCTDAALLATAPGGRFVDPPQDYALRTPTHKLIRYGADGRVALFDLATDPGELHDLAAQQDPTPWARLLDEGLDGAAPRVAPAEDAGTWEALRALGYVE